MTDAQSNMHILTLVYLKGSGILHSRYWVKPILKRTVKMKSFQKNLFKLHLQFHSLVKGHFFYYVFGGMLSS